MRVFWFVLNSVRVCVCARVARSEVFVVCVLFVRVLCCDVFFVCFFVCLFSVCAVLSFALCAFVAFAVVLVRCVLGRTAVGVGARVGVDVLCVCMSVYINTYSIVMLLLLFIYVYTCVSMYIVCVCCAQLVCVLVSGRAATLMSLCVCFVRCACFVLRVFVWSHLCCDGCQLFCLLIFCVVHFAVLCVLFLFCCFV